MVAEKRYVVPDGMLKAAAEAWNAANEPSYSNEGVARITVEAALRWLAENPILPTVTEAEALGKGWETTGDTIPSHRHRLLYVIFEWQRRMFLATEPEVPKDIKDLMHSNENGYPRMTHNDAVLEAYRRGQEAGTKRNW